MQILPPRSSILVHTQGVSPRFQEISRQTWVTGSLLQRNVIEQMLECCLPFPVSVGTFTTVSSSGESVSEKRPPSKPFQQYVSLSLLYAGKDIFLRGRKGIKRECVFRPLPSRNCLASNTGDLQTFAEDLTFKSRQRVSRHIPSLVNTFLGHTATAHKEAGCRSIFESAGCHTVLT